MSHGRRVGLVLFTEPFQFPPTMQAASLLAEHGWEVDIFGLEIPHIPRSALPPGVHLHYFGPVRRGLALRWDYFRFMHWCRQHAARGGHRTFIGYDFMAAWPADVAARRSGGRLIYHNHDLMLKDQIRGGFYRTVKAMEHRAARRAAMVVFPQRERARLFQHEAGLTTMPQIAFNCPRRSWGQSPLPAAPAEFLAWRERVGRVVLYQGGMAQHRGIETLLASVPGWQFAGGLCLLGLPLESGITRWIEKRADELGIRERLLLLPPCSHDALPALTCRADVGVGVMAVGDAVGDDPKYVNLRHLAGASNKIFEYMAAGLPILSPAGGGFTELIAEPQHGVVCDGTSPASIAGALNRLFHQPGLAAAIGQRNRAAFQEQFNYDVQLAPLLRLLEAPVPVARRDES